jgi:signal transduction histidine kinase
MPAKAETPALGLPRHTIRPASPVLAAACAIGLAAVALAVVAPADGTDPAVVAARVAGVSLPVGLGLLRLSRVRSDRFALVLVAAGAVWSLTTLAESSGSTAYSIGRVAVWVLEPLLVFLILAFPYGRLESAVDKRLVAAAIALAALLYIPTALLAPYPEPAPWASCATDCPPNAFLVSSDTAGAIDGFIRPLREVLAVILFSGVVLAVYRRMLRAGELLRVVLMPVIVVAALRVVALGAYFATRSGDDMAAIVDVLAFLYVLSLPLLTVAFAAGLLAHRLFVADALQRLTRTLSSQPEPRELRGALREALKDQSVELLVQPRGTEAAGPPELPEGRAATPVTANGHLLATIVHDDALMHDRMLLDGISAHVRSALEGRRVLAELRSSLDDLSNSRARIVTVADAERRRIERDLHDGAQQRLVALQIKLELLAEQLDDQSPENAVRARALESDIEATLDEVRRFGRGLYPAILADRGLPDALHAIARSALLPTTVDVRLPHRYAREVEGAVYFACVEALQNATKHARGATAVSISLSGNGTLRFDVRDDGEGFDSAATPGGSGLTNIRDRVGAVGGTLEIGSRPGRGTHVTGMIPVP